MKKPNPGQLSMDFGGGDQKEKKTRKPQKGKISHQKGLKEFFDGEDINIQRARTKGYSDEIKGLFIYMVCDLPRYKKCRAVYRKELSTCIKIFGLSYFDDRDIVDIEKFLWSIQKYFIDNPVNAATILDKAKKNNYIREVKNEHIKGIFKENIDALGKVGEKIDEKSRIGLIISLYPSFTRSRQQTQKERQLRYNRIFFQHQLEHKKIYYPHGRKGDGLKMTEADILFDNLGSGS